MFFPELEGGSSAGLHPSPSISPAHQPDAEVLEQARRAETERALDTLWSVASTADATGARWEFRFWSEGGALTLLSLRRTAEGKGELAASNRKDADMLLTAKKAALREVAELKGSLAPCEDRDAN